MATPTTASVPDDLRRLIVVVMRSVVLHVVMASTDHAVTTNVVANNTVMILHPATCPTAAGTTSSSTARARPLVAAVRIVKQRVLVRLRVKVVVDLGLQLVGNGCGGGSCCRC